MRSNTNAAVLQNIWNCVALALAPFAVRVTKQQSRCHPRQLHPTNARLCAQQLPGPPQAGMTTGSSAASEMLLAICAQAPHWVHMLQARCFQQCTTHTHQLVYKTPRCVKAGSSHVLRTLTGMHNSVCMCCDQTAWHSTAHQVGVRDVQVRQGRQRAQRLRGRTCRSALVSVSCAYRLLTGIEGSGVLGRR